MTLDQPVRPYAVNQPAPATQPATVVVVDDEPLMRTLTQRMLVPTGHFVLSAEDASNALALIAAYKPQAIVCDVHMPGFSGLWLADQIRERFPSIAIVLATGDRHVPPTQSLRRGIVAYLVKPIRQSELLRAVDEGVAWSRRHAR